MNMQYPDVESMICQMIMIGLKGSNKKDIANFMETLPSQDIGGVILYDCLLYTSPSPRDTEVSRMPSSA